jgi:hypothetical protein
MFISATRRKWYPQTINVTASGTWRGRRKIVQVSSFQ